MFSSWKKKGLVQVVAGCVTLFILFDSVVAIVQVVFFCLGLFQIVFDVEVVYFLVKLKWVFNLFVFVLVCFKKIIGSFSSCLRLFRFFCVFYVIQVGPVVTRFLTSYGLLLIV